MSKFGWAYIGVGSIAHSTAKQLRKSENNEIVAVWNRTYEKAEKFVRKYGGTAYRSFEEAVNDPKVEGVYIALTANLHYEYMKKCIELHKPVLCEKPFTVNAQEAKEIFELAEKEGVYVAEAMWTWHNTPALTVRKWLEEGKIGKVTEVECDYKNPAATYGKNGRLFDASRIGGALMDVGIYPLRYTLELFGTPERFECTGKTSRGVDIREDVDFFYQDFTVRHHISLDDKFSEHYTIKGTEGEIRIPFFHTAWKASLKGSRQGKVSAKRSQLYETEFTNTANEIRAGLIRSAIIRPEKTIECMEIMDACRKELGVLYPSEKTVDLEKNYAVTISHLGFNCKDLEKSIAFYRDILGCREKFTMTYGDMADDICKKASEKGEKVPFYAKMMGKMRDTKWSVYMSWSENTFIELFNIPRAKRKRVPNPADDLNYTHYSLQVTDLHAFRDQIISRGGAQYIDKDIEMGMDNTWVMWMKDPDGNPFEIMEYTETSYQTAGR